MAYVRTTPATSDPVTLAEAKAHCRVTGAAEDAYITDLISKATWHIEQLTGRALMRSTWTLTLDAFPGEIVIERLPMAAVTSIQYVDLDGVTQTLDAASYQVDIGGYRQPGRIKPAYNCSWPDTRGDTYKAVTVTFTAGVTTSAEVTHDAKQAILYLVAYWRGVREPANIGNIVNAMPFSLDALLGSEDWGAY